MRKATCIFLCILSVPLEFTPLAWGQGLPTTSPESVGLCEEQLGRITALMRKHVDDRRLAGAVALVARGGKVAYLESVGMQDAEHGIKMRPNTIFRIASMTKPITSVAVMMLYEEGHFRLHEPISKFIPEFKDPVVLADESSDEETVPAKRQITIHHLLTHTSGLTNFGDRRLAARYRKAGITNGITHDEDLLGDDMPKLAKLPLAHHPGEAYTYGLSYDVLGRLVEVVSGMSLDEFFRTRIFEPLGMEDTYFYLLEDKVSRLAAAYAPDSDDGLKRLTDEILGKGTMGYTVTYPYQGPKRYFSGGGGLCSTVPDYARFAQMLLNGGELDGVRLLSHKTVELMTTDHVGELRRGLGWGLGFSVKRTMKEAGELGSVGTFGWWGFWYTIFFVDPQEKMVGICMAQLHPFGGADLCAKFRPLACQAIVD